MASNPCLAQQRKAYKIRRNENFQTWSGNFCLRAQSSLCEGDKGKPCSRPVDHTGRTGFLYSKTYQDLKLSDMCGALLGLFTTGLVIGCVLGTCPWFAHI